MKPDELIRLAAQGGEMPVGLDAADAFLFLSMRNLYSYAKREGMPKEQGVKEKSEILKRYDSLSLWLNVADEHMRKEREFGTAFDEFAKDPTLENADKLHRAWFNCGLNVKANAGKEETE